MGSLVRQSRGRLVRAAEGVQRSVRDVHASAVGGAWASGGHPRRPQQQDAGQAMTRAVVVRYRVRPDAVEENIRLVRAVYDELGASRPDGLRYSTMRVDGTTFVHVAVIEAEENPL